MGVGPYELLSQLIGETLKSKNPDRTDTADIPVAKGSSLNVSKSSGYGFSMNINNAVVGLKECRFDVTLQNTSLIGFLSNGAPRISQGNVVRQSVSLPFSGDGFFVIGGLNKKEVSDSSTGIPWLSDIPILGYLFSSKSKSVKNSELIVVGQCNWSSPDDDTRSNMTKTYLKP
jgi:Flp pilus assembly secretin CpaC